MSDAQNNRRRDLGRDAREASARKPLIPSIPVRFGSNRENVERQKAAIRARYGERFPEGDR